MENLVDMLLERVTILEEVVFNKPKEEIDLDFDEDLEDILDAE